MLQKLKEYSGRFKEAMKPIRPKKEVSTNPDDYDEYEGTSTLDGFEMFGDQLLLHPDLLKCKESKRSIDVSLLCTESIEDIIKQLSAELSKRV